ncbi:MAG TPA: ABC transporter substrate-binding protein [Desulfobacterales bacterium]|jgi:NitT/TauT family transport system substrate-binding protein|nr:ABC transporter substrate-binding protein [Desulfobacterales bacterium]
MKRAFLFLSGLFFIFACGQEEKIEEVNYRLKWLYNVSVVGDLYADVYGHFAENGLKVNVKPGGPERDALKELELGHAQFGVASADQVLRAVAKGAPIVVLAQLFQVNPLHWIYRPDKTPFSGPADWKGKTIGVTFGGNDEAIMRALLARYRIAENEVSLFSVRYDYTPFYEGRVAFWPLYLNAQAVIIGDKLAQAGETFDVISPDRLGVKFVANSVVTTREMIEKHPDTVKRFLAALRRGWQDALNPQNEEQAVKVLLQMDRETAAAVVRRQLAVTRELMLPAPGTAFGTIDTDAWKQTAQIMSAQQLIPPTNVESVLMTDLIK